ncbi:hypothetical protein SDC9_189605 [bioreactor metagenome]|uniref:Uncharacterized protein n=1 Tax=bioreactor metagenome TaxID=1076179 RepID=A0A645HV30_9ZZZZ
MAHFFALHIAHEHDYVFEAVEPQLLKDLIPVACADVVDHDTFFEFGNVDHITFLRLSSCVMPALLRRAVS